jgi:hypothetical protein
MKFDFAHYRKELEEQKRLEKLEQAERKFGHLIPKGQNGFAGGVTELPEPTIVDKLNALRKSAAAANYRGQTVSRPSFLKREKTVKEIIAENRAKKDAEQAANWERKGYAKKFQRATGFGNDLLLAAGAASAPVAFVAGAAAGAGVDAISEKATGKSFGEMMHEKTGTASPEVWSYANPGYFIGGIAGKKAGNHTVSKNNNPSFVRVNTIYDKTKVPFIYKKASGVPEKINYDSNKFYRIVGEDAIRDIEASGKVKGIKKYGEKIIIPAESSFNRSGIPQEVIRNKRIYSDPNSKPKEGVLAELHPNSEKFVYVGRGKPLTGHEPSFQGSKKGEKVTTRTPSSEKRVPRDHVIEFPENTPVVEAGNLWTYLGDKPIKDWSKFHPEQHLSLYNGEVKWDPKSMNVWKLVDKDKQLFVKKEILENLHRK